MMVNGPLFSDAFVGADMGNGLEYVSIPHTVEHIYLVGKALLECPVVSREPVGEVPAVFTLSELASGLGFKSQHAALQFAQLRWLM